MMSIGSAKQELTNLYNKMYSDVMSTNGPGFYTGSLDTTVFSTIKALLLQLVQQEPVDNQALFGEFDVSQQEVTAGVWQTHYDNRDQIFVDMQVLPLDEGSKALPLHVHKNSWRLLVCIEGASYAWSPKDGKMAAHLFDSLSLDDLESKLIVPGMYIAFPEGNNEGDGESYAHSFTAYAGDGSTSTGGRFLTLHGRDMLKLDPEGKVVGSEGDEWTIVNDAVDLNSDQARQIAQAALGN